MLRRQCSDINHNVKMLVYCRYRKRFKSNVSSVGSSSCFSVHDEGPKAKLFAFHIGSTPMFYHSHSKYGLGTQLKSLFYLFVRFHAILCTVYGH